MADRHRPQSRRNSDDDPYRRHEVELEGQGNTLDRGHNRSIRRDQDYHVVHEGDRTFPRDRLDEPYGEHHVESLRNPCRARNQGYSGEPLDENIEECREEDGEFFGRRQGERYGDRYLEREEQHLESVSELRRRQNRESLNISPFRRSHIVADEGVRNENPFQQPPRNVPDPAPVDFPVERPPPQNGQHGPEDQDPRVREGMRGAEKPPRRNLSKQRPEDQDPGLREAAEKPPRRNLSKQRPEEQDPGLREAPEKASRRYLSKQRAEELRDPLFTVEKREGIGSVPLDVGPRTEDVRQRSGYLGHRPEEPGYRLPPLHEENRVQKSHMELISAETFPHHSRQRAGEPQRVPSPTHNSPRHGMSRTGSGRGSRNRTHETSQELRKSKMDELKRRSGEQKTPSKDLARYTILKEEEEDPAAAAAAAAGEEGVTRHASVLLPVLEEIERVFHDLVAAGDIEGTKIFLDEHPGFNINCVNYQKISALHVAVKQQNEGMVEFLLQEKDLDISDCALYAIKSGNLKIVEMILDAISQRSPKLEYAGPTHSVDFSDDMTPIILAAQLGNYEMISLLIKRGHSIPPVHPPFCKCDRCKYELKKYDRLRYSTMKLNLYKAISNPMYIFHSTDDPFQRAFELVKELQEAAIVFPPFKSSFEELWENLRKFSTDLIGCCRNAQEVEIVLKKSPYSVAEHVIFPRLQYAIDLKQKEFVSHPYTQAVLGDAWTGDLLEWKIRSPLMQSLSVLPRIPMLPVMTVMCIFLPDRGIVKKWKTPVNKMISSVASYLVFLLILFLESNLDKKNQKRGPPNSGLEGVIIIYVVGYIWLNIRICFKQGIKRFFTTMWHWYDTIMLFLFTLTIIFWIASWVDITANGDIDLPRKYWNSLDPELVAEGFFAAAVIMAFFRLNLFLSLNYYLGPLQVSMGKMTLDIFRFIIIFSVIILAWCAGLCRFYQPYEGMVQKDAVSGTTTTQVSSFVNFLMTLKTFFWAIFGMSPIESADVVIENLPGDTPDTTIINQHQFTESIGYIAFALFQFLSVVVVLNMLVACMANTFTKVIDNVAVEWVFGRSQIYLSFMANSILPPPFNLVPTISGLKGVITWFRLLGKPHNGQKAKCNLSHCCYIESETEPYVNTEFPALMSELAQRYIRLKSEIEAEEATNELEEIKTELNEMKETLRKICIVTKC